MIGKFNLPDNGIPIRVGDSGFIYEDVYHPIEWYGGEPYRPRVETLVLNKTCDRVFMDRGEGNHYRIPGGSIDPDSTYDKQAENETNEEALIRVTNVFFTGVVYHQPMDKDYLAKGGDGCVPYVGSTNRVYTAIYAGMIDRSTIEEKDLDDHMAKNGKFYEISSVIDILRVGHIQALINSERIRDKKILSLLYGKLNELTMKQPMSTVFESRSTETAEMETKYIYHGSTYDIDVFHPMSLDLGNAEQGPGWSTFCFYNFDLARRFALMRLIQKYLGGSNDSKRRCNWDLKRSMPYLHHSVYAEVLNGIENEKFYVYTIDASPLNLGVGNDERFPEVTFREDGVIPYKKTVCYTDEDFVRQDIEIILEDPDAFEKKQMEQIENLNRGWKTCMLNRDYSGDSAVAKLTKAVSDGKLKPGDDVNAYMDEHGISLKDISFLERLHDTKAVQEAFDVSDNFEDTILLGNHRVLHASEWKCIDGVEVPEKCYCEDGLYLPATMPDDSRIIHRGFLYEIQEGGTLAFIGQYEITLWDEERIPKPAYFLRMFVCKPYRKLGIGSVIAGYVTRYQKEEKIDEIIVKVANSIWEITGIRNWIKTFTSCGVIRMKDSVIVTIDNVEEDSYEDRMARIEQSMRSELLKYIAESCEILESCEQNLSNLSWYHAEMARSGFNPKIVGSRWDEELYSKDIDHALKQAFMSAVASNKELLKEKKFTLYMYTAGEELSAIYLGKVTMYYYGLEDNGYIPKFDWEWAEQEEFSDAFLSNLKEEVHPALEQTIPYKPGKRLSLSDFKAVRANYNTISKYKGGTSALKWVESDNVSDGCVWLDSDGNFVGACTVAKGLLDKFNEITAIEVSNEYKCHGLGRQILDYAVKTLRGNALMVEYDNIPALSLYEQYGFKISTGSKTDVDSGGRHSYFMYLPSRISPADKKLADEVRIGPDPAVVETVEDADNDNTIVEEGIADTSLAPIFIVCTFTGTSFGKVVTKIQHCKFSHSGLSLDSDLKHIYTFNTHSKKTGGAGIESIDEYDNVSTGESGDIYVMCFFVPLSVKESVRQVVDRIFSNVDKTRYAFGNLLNILANRAVDTKDSLKMVCSQFVDYCLKAANIDLTNKSSNLVSPNDFASIPKKNPKVFVLFDGKKSEYSSKKADGKIYRLLRTREPEELSVVAEGACLLEACKNVDEARKFVRDVGRLAKKYNANYFIVTDGASGTSNNGNPAVKHARESQIAWERQHGYDPDEDWTGLYESVLTENVIFNKDNTVYNIDKFESGKSNVLLVTGLSGSGKSTIAEEYARKYKAEWIELDIFEQCHGFTDQSLKEAGEVFYDYLSSHKSLWEKLKSKSIKGKELGEEINKFVHYCFAWCRSRKDTKWIIEGVQIYSFLTADEVKGFPLIIMGTSMKNSILQRFKRNGDGKIEWGKELKNEFPNLIQWYWGEEKYLKSFEKEVKHVSESTLPDGFTLPEQGDFEQYRNSVELEDARNAIPDEVMEGWLTALMEAGKDSDGLPSLGKDDKTGDYSADAEKSVEQDTDTPTETNNEPTEDEGDDSTDYTEDADSDDDTETEDTEDDAGGEVDGPDDTGTDYTDDAGADGGAEGESTDTQPEQQTDTQSGNNGVKNCTLLTDFESLYRLASEISETIEPIIMEKPIQNKVLTQVRSNLSAIKASIMQFITLHFKADDYAFNLYYYEIFIGLLSKNLEMLEKNRQFSSSSKTNGKKDKE